MTTEVLAFYLPQFHPIPENDRTWGQGFTEWTNVMKARPLFSGHYQPRIPADLGFYDLRDSEIRCAQAELARRYGVTGFCYYHYWFSGHRVLERPFNEVLESGKPDFPFCLCWANQSWTGIWYGAPQNIILEQRYPGAADYIAHMDFLCQAFKDKRYICVDGCPLLLIFSPYEIPDLLKVLGLLRALAKQRGFPGLHLVGVRTYPTPAHAMWGFDGWITQRPPLIPKEFDRSAERKVPLIMDHRQVAPLLVNDDETCGMDYPCTGPNWDNTPRCGNRGIVLHESSPDSFRVSLKMALQRVSRLPEGRKLLFIKAWNEWAEGNHMEPDQRFGRGYLEALHDELSRAHLSSAS